eukprot:SAG11_NODE_21520_length_423_cov_5.916667_1_plen_89_part_01
MDLNHNTASRRCLPLVKEIVGLLVVHNVSLIVAWCDTHQNRHADLLSRWADPAEDRVALLRELRAIRAAKPRRHVAATERRRPARPDLA